MDQYEKEFVKAVMDDEVERVKFMIREDMNLCSIEIYEGMLLIRYIVQQKRHKMFRLFLRKGADVTSPVNGKTSIAEDVRASGDAKLIQILEKHLAHVNRIEQEVTQAAAARDFSGLKEKAIAREQEMLHRDQHRSIPAVQLRHELLNLFTADIDYTLFCEEFVKLENPFIYSNNRNETLLHLSVRYQRYDIMKMITNHQLFQQYCITQNQYGKTALHVAVISGDVEAYQILIVAMIRHARVTCSNGLTILHYAAQYGHLAILTEMLFGVLNVLVSQLFDICDDAGKFALHHAAAQAKSVECLEILLEKETRAIAIDNLRNTPLHYAAIHGIYDNVKILLEAGLSPYQKNSAGKCALDLAVELGQHDIADLMTRMQIPDDPILGYGHLFSTEVRKKLYQVDQHLLKDQTELALPLLTDLIFCAKDSSNYRLEVYVQLKAGKHIIFNAEDNYLNLLYPTMKLPERDWDNEKAILTLLEESEQAGQPYLTVKCLKRLADFSLAKNQYAQAAQLFNSALTLYQKSIPSIRVGGAQSSNNDEQFLLQCISSTVEKMGAHLNIGLRYEQSRIQAYRSMLAKSRSECSFTHVELSEQNQHVMTHCYRTIFSAIVDHNRKIVGLSLDQFSVVLCGSVARSETSLYSDVEYIIVTANDDPQQTQLFENLARLIELDMINIGETEYRILNRGQKSILKPGFCLDPHGITPRGRIDPNTGKTISEYKLIGTPKTVAQLVNHKNFVNERELVVSLCTTEHLIGNRELAQKFISEVTAQLDNSQSVFSRVAQFFSPKTTLRTLISQQCLLALTDEFQPRLDQVKNQEKFFMVKQELYRILERFISSISMLANCPANSAWSRLDFFVEKNILTAQAASDLKNALNLVLLLRCRVQNHYRSEFDGAWHLRSRLNEYVLPNGMKPYEVYLLSKVDIESIQSIYCVLLPITAAIKKLIANNYNLRVLQECTFKTKLNQVQGSYYSTMHDYEHANEHYEKSIALNPNDAVVIASYIKTLSMRGQGQKAIAIGLEAMQRWEQQSNTSDLDYALLLNNLAHVLSDNGRRPEGLEVGLKAYKIVDHITPMSEFSHTMLLTLINLTDNEKEKTLYLQTCEKIERTVSIDPLMIARRMQENARILRENRKLNESLKLIDIALEIVQQSQCDYRLMQKDLLSSKATILWELGHPEEGYKIYQELHQLSIKIHGELHETTEGSYGDLAVSLLYLKQFAAARTNAEKALAINLKISPYPNDRLGIRYNTLARIYQGLGNHKEAIKYEEMAVAADKNFFGIDHMKTVIRLGDLAAVAFGHNMMVWERANEEAIDIIGRINPAQVGVLISRTAASLQGSHEYELCLKYFIRLLPYLDDKDQTAIAYSNIAGLYMMLGQHEKASEYKQKLSSLQDDSPILISNQAIFLRNQRNYSAAVMMHKKAIATETRLNGSKSEMLGKLIKYLADTYQLSGDYLEATKYYQQAVEIFRVNFHDDHHPLIEDCLSQLKFIQELLDIATGFGNKGNSEGATFK